MDNYSVAMVLPYHNADNDNVAIAVVHTMIMPYHSVKNCNVSIIVMSCHVVDNYNIMYALC